VRVAPGNIEMRSAALIYGLNVEEEFNKSPIIEIEVKPFLGSKMQIGFCRPTRGKTPPQSGCGDVGSISKIALRNVFQQRVLLNPHRGVAVENSLKEVPG